MLPIISLGRVQLVVKKGLGVLGLHLLWESIGKIGNTVTR
jgi:hypothetical protein